MLIASLWLATVCNLPLWRQLLQLPELANPRGLLLAGALLAIITAANAIVLGLLAWRRVLAPALVLWLLAAAAGAHFMLAFGVVIDATMMVNVLQTNPGEALDLLNLRLLLTLLVFGALPAWWLLRRPITYRPPLRQLLRNGMVVAGALAVALLALALSFQVFASTMRNHTQLRYLINPLNSLAALGNIATKPLRMDTRSLLPIGTDAQLGASYATTTRPPLVVLVLGETGRRGNFALNGYGRPTNPLLATQNVVSQTGTVSCGTNTAASVPCMFSALGREAFEARKNNYENLLDVLQRAGLAVLWVDNQAGCKGVCDRVPHADTGSSKAPAYCTDGECLDEVMLQGLDERLQALDPARRARGTVVVLHQMGSHGPAYHRRSPADAKRFLPECTSNNLQDCSQQELVNAYDNTIVYTDRFLNSTIEWLKAHSSQAETAMVYVADHGESLGENNLYLHGLPYFVAPDVQKQVPWITWLSPGFEARRGTRSACLQQQRNLLLSHDNYFHSVLGLLDVHTSVYRPALDLYAACTKA